MCGRPITKKNSQRVVTIHGHTVILPSRAYTQYEADCLRQLNGIAPHIDCAVNLACVYFMPTRHRVDLANLIEATQDILKAAGVIVDDNKDIVASLDGSRVDYDREKPRVEIEITVKA